MAIRGWCFPLLHLFLDSVKVYLLAFYLLDGSHVKCIKKIIKSWEEKVGYWKSFGNLLCEFQVLSDQFNIILSHCYPKNLGRKKVAFVSQLAIAGITILLPSLSGKSLRFIWRLGTLDEICGCPVFRWVAETSLHDRVPVPGWYISVIS